MQGGEIFNFSGVEGDIYPPWFDSEDDRVLGDRMIPVIPRYDDYKIYQMDGRTYYMRFDVNYTEGLYDRQWRWALVNECNGSIDLVMIYGWNEYHERSTVSPHFDKSGADPYLIFNKTRDYIWRLKNREAFVINETGVSSQLWKNKQIIIDFLTPVNKEVFCSSHGAPKYIRGGRLESYDDTLKMAKIAPSKSKIVIYWSIWPFVTPYICAGLVASGAGIAYFLFRRQKQV